MSVLTVVAAARQGSTLWAETTMKVSVPYWGLSMALNITLSLLLILRLLSMQRTLRQVLGEDYARVYTKIVSMSVESALPYALVSFIFIILYGIQNSAYVLFLPILVQVQVSFRSLPSLIPTYQCLRGCQQCIAPELIILQVTRGKAWSNTTRPRSRQVEISTVLDVVGSSGFGTEPYNAKVRNCIQPLHYLSVHLIGLMYSLSTGSRCKRVTHSKMKCNHNRKWPLVTHIAYETF